MSHSETLDELRDRLVASHPLKNLWLVPLMDDRQAVRIDTIRIEPDARGQGHGDQVLREIVEWADRNGLTLALTPSADWDAKNRARGTARLARWYRRHGFVPNKGRRKDYRFSDAMIRLPRPVANPVRIRDDERFCEEVADAYDRAALFEPEELWRWKLLQQSVRKMFGQISKQVDVRFVSGQPYDSAEQMRDDVKRTGVLEISTDFNEHPFFSPEDNLKFRAVHDYVVHILPGPRGPDFSRRGEIRAYNLHRRLAPRDAWPALFTEVLGQACYANARGEFPVQKLAVLSEFDFYNVGYRASEARRQQRVARSISATL